MARVIYQASPENVPAGPAAIPGGGYQRIEANPAQFGALQGQAEQKLAAGVEEAGSQTWQVYQQQQNLYNEVAAQDAYNNVQRTYTNLTFGDPNDPTKPGYYSLRGADALSQRASIVKQLDDARTQARATLPNMRAQLEFDRESRYLQRSTEALIGRHADQQMQSYAAETQKSTQQLELQAISANYSDPQMVADHTERYVRASVREAQTLYGANADPAIINNAVTQARSAAVAAQIQGHLAHNDMAGAAGVLKANEGKLEPGIAARYHGVLGQAQVESAVDDALGTIKGKPTVTPDQVSGAAVQQGVDPALANATAHIESGHGANVGSRGNIYQLGQPERSGMGVSGQGSPQTQLDYGVGFLAKTKETLAGVMGANVTNSDVYLAHQQGVDGARKLLQNPNARAGDLVGDQAIAANGGDPSAPARQFTDMWRDRYNRTEKRYAQNTPASMTDAGPQQPDYSSAERSIWDRPDLNDQQKRQAVNLLKDRANVDWTEQTRAYEQQRRQSSQAAETAASDVVSRLIKDPTSVDPKADIADNPAFATVHNGREIKENLWKLQQSAMAGGNDHDTKTYGRGFYDIYRRVHASDDDPTRITDPNQLYNHVGPNGDLTVSGVEKLTQEIQGKRTPEGEAWAETQKQFIKNAHAQISGHDMGLHIPDPKGEALFLKFMAQALPTIQAARNAGKTPSEIFDPDSKEYVGKIIDGFMRPRSQRIKDMSDAMAGGEEKDAGPSGAEAMLRAGPDAILPDFPRKTVRQFYDEKYGAGAADKILSTPAPTPAPSAPIR